MVGNDDVEVGWWFVRRAEGHREGLRRGQARNKDQFPFEVRSVGVLGGTSIDGFGEVGLRFHWFLRRIVREEFYGKEVADSEKDEEEKEDERGKAADEPKSCS